MLMPKKVKHRKVQRRRMKGRAKGGKELTLMLHKLAGTAAIFGEAQLGVSAAALERAIKRKRGHAVLEALARELIVLADETGTAARSVA